MASTTSAFIEEHGKVNVNSQETTALDIGCGIKPLNPFGSDYLFGVDIRESKENGIISADLLTEPIPFENSFFNFVTAHDFIEHVPRVVVLNGRTFFPFIELMNEVHRVLKPGGLFFSKTPAYPAPEAFQDPTHVNIIRANTFPLYFCINHAGAPWAAMYGFVGSFELVGQKWCQTHLLTIIRK
jgi:SAM-dependent methyltransferase